MSKILKFHQDALKAIQKGVKTLSKAVIVTLGPKGRNVVIHRGHGVPLSTKDGVTVAKEINRKDKFENMGAQLVKEAASKTNDATGDGTTTAIVLADKIFSEGLKNVIAGANPMSVKGGIEKSSKAVIRALENMAEQITKPEEILQIATISANNDPEVGALIAKAIEKVGKDGIISIADGKGHTTELEVKEGLQFDKGFLSPYFITNGEKMTCEFAGAHIFITDQKLSTAQDVVPILEMLVENKLGALLIVADDIVDEALSTLVLNKIKGGLSICAVKTPGFGDRRKALLEDMATLTGATFITPDIGLDLKSVTVDVLGHAKSVKVAKETTTIIDGAGSPAEIQKRIAQIKKEIALSESDYDREKLQERLAKMSGGVAVINVGAASESEANETKMRIEDALHAARAAVRGGIVPGGGVAFLRAVKALDHLELPEEEIIGKEIVREACFSPARAIAQNCGLQGDLIAQKIFEGEGDFGFDAAKEEFCSLKEAGVIDPVEVSISALKYASEISSLMVTISVMIADKPTPKKEGPSMDGMGMDPMSGMGGMGGFPGMDMM